MAASCPEDAAKIFRGEGKMDGVRYWDVLEGSLLEAEKD